MPDSASSNGKAAIAFISAALDDYGLDPYEFRVLARLSRRDGEKGMYESVAKIAAGCRMSEREVQYALRILVRAGMAREVKRPGFTSEYHLAGRSNWVKPEGLDAIRSEVKGAHRMHPRIQSTPAPGAPEGRTVCTTTPAPGAPKGTPIEGTPLKGIPKKQAKGARAGKKQKKPFPEDFSVTEEMRLWAKGLCDEHSVDVDLETETENFKDYCLSNGAAYADYFAAWRTRIRNCVTKLWGTGKPRGQNGASQFSNGNRNGKANAEQGKSAPGGYRTPKPVPAVAAEPELLEVSGQGVADHRGQGREAVSMPAAEDRPQSPIGDPGEVRTAKVIPFDTAARFAQEPGWRRGFG